MTNMHIDDNYVGGGGGWVILTNSKGELIQKEFQS